LSQIFLHKKVQFTRKVKKIKKL